MLVNNLSELNKDFNFTIVGSGPASLTLALQLEKKGFSVLILEAGIDEISANSQEYYKGKVIGDEYYDLAQTRLRCLGGSSQHWQGWCRTLDKVDFENWPIEHKNLNNYLQEACKILDIDSDFSDIEVNKNINQIKFQFSKTRFKDKYFQHLKKSKKIFLCLNTAVLKIIGDKDTVKSVDLKISENKTVNLKVKNLIVGCGGLENSRILLWSKETADNGFLRDLQIGHYWMEHPHYEAGAFIGEFSDIKKIFNTQFSKYNEIYFAPSGFFLKKNKIKNISLRFQYQFDDEFIKNTLVDLKCSGPKYFQKLLKDFKKNQLCSFKIQAIWEQPPFFDNKIKLSTNLRDKNNIPQIELYWKKKEIEKKAPRIFLNELGNYFKNNQKGRIGILNFLNQENNFFPSTTHPGGHHHLGGTRMGYSTRDNDIVDKNLKVFGVNNLYIVGSSVFRTGGHANPTLSIVQLSLRLADYLENKQNI